MAVGTPAKSSSNNCCTYVSCSTYGAGAGTLNETPRSASTVAMPSIE
jgi:hypothetical protein